jgi:hypothetical protein
MTMSDSQFLMEINWVRYEKAEDGFLGMKGWCMILPKR